MSQLLYASLAFLALTSYLVTCRQPQTYVLYRQFSTIKSTNYPENYPAFDNTTWIVRRLADDVCQYYIEFVVFKVESSKKCYKDYLQINEEIRYCGLGKPGPTSAYLHGDLEIKFHSDGTNSEKGFLIIVEQSRFSCTRPMTKKPTTTPAPTTTPPTTTTLTSTVPPKPMCTESIGADRVTLTAMPRAVCHFDCSHIPSYSNYTVQISALKRRDMLYHNCSSYIRFEGLKQKVCHLIVKYPIRKTYDRRFCEDILVHNEHQNDSISLDVTWA